MQVVPRSRTAERWQSGRMRRFAKPLYGLTPVPRVRIPPSPPVFDPHCPFDQTCIIPRMRGTLWSTTALGLLLLISTGSIGGQEVSSPQPEKSKPPVQV